MRILLLLLLVAVPAMAQNWSSFLDPSRAIDWSSAGFSIPSYTVNCATQPSLTSGSGAATTNTTSINNALASCDSTHNVVLIPAGTWYVNMVSFGSQGNEVLRGAGTQSTKLIFQNVSGCVGGIGNQGLCLKDPNGVYNGNAAVLPGGTQACTWSGTNGTTGTYTQGAATINLTSCGGAPPLNEIIILDQANDTSDTSGIYICQQNASTNCNNNGTGNNDGRVIGGVSYSQQQVTKITSVTSLGGGAYTVTISPGVYFSNVRSSQSPGAWWPGFVQHDGVEAMTLDGTALTGGGNIGIGQCYQCWVKDVVSLYAGRNHIGIYMSLDDVVRDSYFYQAQTHGSSSYGVEFEETSQTLVENDIFQQTVAPVMFGQGSGNVIGYNFDVNNYYTGNGSDPPDVLEASSGSHNSGNEMNLWEGNIGQAIWIDNVWGSSSQITYFRNAMSGWQKQFAGSAAVCGSNLCEETAFIIRAFNRAENIVGNVIGQPGYSLTYEMYATSTTAGTGGSEDNSIYSLGWAGGGFGGTNNGNCTATLCDPLARSTLMRWGNYDAVNKAAQWSSAEASPASVPYVNANFTSSYFSTLAHTLPASLYYSAKPSWWGSQAWPPIGPDVTTGNVSTCNGGTYGGSRAVSSAQCTGGSLNPASSSTAGWSSMVAANPATQCYLSTMNGPPDGSGSLLTFDANTCYAASTPGGSYLGGGTRWSSGMVVDAP